MPTVNENNQPLADPVSAIGPRLGLVLCSDPATSLATRSLAWIEKMARGLGLEIHHPGPRQWQSWIHRVRWPRRLLPRLHEEGEPFGQHRSGH
jgi:hypothetical protein